MIIHILALLLTILNIGGDRLPTGIEVLQYNLHLNFTEDSFTRPPYEYEGYLKIRFTLYQNYKSDVKLHAASDFINIKSAVLDINSSLTDITSFEVDKENDIVMLVGTEKANQYVYSSYLYISYTSRLSVDDMYGLYKTEYTRNGKTTYMVSSQFEPTFARRVFPCLDEPIYKTDIRLNVTHPPDKEVYFNTAVDDSVNATDIINDDKSVTTYFRLSGTMAPYMAGLVITSSDDFTCTLGQNFTSGTIYYYRVCSRYEIESIRKLALDTAPDLMADLYNVTNYGYGVIMGFQKMELFALPDMPADATENWGIITYREQDLLYDENNSSNLDKQNIVEMLTFEFAQMWFGNMASPEWWQYTYLTKGLAYYLKYLITARVFYEWDLSKQFVYRVFQPVLELDSLNKSSNLRNGANSTIEIIAKFDKITLLKGACLYRMLNEVIAGYKNFRQGLEYFLTSFSFRNSEPQGLWNLISAQINLNNRALLPTGKYLKEILIDWETNPGFPLLEVTRDGENVTVKQKIIDINNVDTHVFRNGVLATKRDPSYVDSSLVGRFLYTGVDTTYEWYVPVSYVFSSNLTDFDNTTLNQYVLPNSSLEIELPSQDEKWVLLNSQATGYYRVHYGDMWQNISSALHESDFSGIPELNRAQILDDVFALARANFLNYSFVFGLVDYLAAEESLYPWMSAMKGANYLLTRVGTTTNLGLKIEARFLTYLSKIYSSVPWSNLNADDHVYSIKQMEILEAACKLGYIDCVKSATSQFTSFKNTGNRPHKNLRRFVYCTGLLYGTSTVNWDVLWNAYGSTDLAAERVKILSALGCTENLNLLQKSLALTIDEFSGVKAQDASIVFTSVYTNSKAGVNAALNFLVQNHQIIVKRYQDMNSLRNMILGLAEHLTETNQISQFKQFLRNTQNLAEEFKSVAEEAIEITEVNTMWLNDHLDELKKYFEIHLEEDESSVSSGSMSTSGSTSTQSGTSSTTAASENMTGKSNHLVRCLVLIILPILIALKNCSYC